MTMKASSSESKLSILGGPRSVPENTEFKMWPPVDERDEQLVLEALRQNNHCYGPHVEKLTEEFGTWNGNKHCIATNSGTAALHMCVAGCGIGAGDEVITTALSWTSSATCIIHHNAIPVFVDVDWTSMCIDPVRIEAAITDRTKGILVVHYFGISCDMDPILDIARRYNLKLIEDACQAHGATYRGKKVGTIADCGAFSLNQNKNLCGGEGGFFVTDDPDILEPARAVMSFSDFRPAGSGRDYHRHGLGWKYGTANLPAAFALSQLRKLDETNAWAVKNWHHLDHLLEGTPNLVRPFSSEERPVNGYAYCLRTDPVYARKRGISLSALTDAVANALKAEGAPFMRANWMLPAHGIFQDKDVYGQGSPWQFYARNDITYETGQWPVSQDCVDTCLWNIKLHRPPNRFGEVEAAAHAIRKVYENLDSVPVDDEKT